MLDQRLIVIVKYVSLGERNIDSLTRLINTNEHKLMYSLDKLNDILHMKNISKITIDNGKSLIISEETLDYIKNGEVFRDVTFSNYNLSMEERLNYIYILLFCAFDYVPLVMILNNLGVSRSTVLEDIKNLRENLTKHNIDLTYDRTNGYKIQGDEITIRSHFLSTMYKYEKVSSAEYYNPLIYELQRQLNKESEYNEEYFVDFAAKMTYADSNFFLVIIPFMYNRFKKYQLKVDPKVKEIISKESMYHELVEMMKQHHLDIDSNLYYLSSLIISLTPMTPNIKILDEIMDVMKTIINKFTAHAGSTITDQDHFVDQLHLHFRPLFFRLLFKIPVNNPLTLEIKEKYHYIFNLVERSVEESIVGFNLTFSDSEIAYLTLHFASIYFQITKNRHNNILYQGSIYCPNGIGTSLLLKNELEVLLPNWSFETFSDLNLLNEVSKDSEIIFTTTIIPLNEIQERDIIIVPPILSARDKHTIIEKTSSIVGEKDSIKVAKVLQVVRSHVPENTMKKIMTELQESLEIEMEERKVLPMLSEITKPELIQLDVSVENWKEAICKGAQPLLNEEYIEQSYVEAMIKVAETNGPYIVITKHLAMPHARAEDGVNKIGISIAVLKDPVEFGNKSNDPVKYVFCLAAIDNFTHLRAMGDLAEILAYDTFYQVLNNAKDPQEIYDYILDFEKRGEMNEERINSL